MSVRNLFGTPLERRDIEKLKQSGISAQTAEQALLRRVDSLTGAQIVGRNGGGDYAGVVFPYILPGTDYVRECRLRRDNPELEQVAGGRAKEQNKYISPPGRGAMLYFVPGTEPVWLDDISLTVVMTEGEKKALALWELSWHGLGDAAEQPRWLTVGLGGVWNFRGKVGKTENARGVRVDVKGPIPDLDRIAWPGRQGKILFDSNVHTNEDVRIARLSLAKELRSRGALVLFVDIPADASVNGIDDLIGVWGPDRVLKLITNEAYDPKKKPREKVSAKDAWVKSIQTAVSSKPASNDVLGDIEAFIRLFVVLPECGYLPVSLWAMATYLSKEFDAFPYIALVSPIKRCGKTRMLEVLELLSAFPWRGTTPTAAALYRMMAESPTLLLDEVEALMNQHASETQQTLLAILNAGHRQGATVPRCDGPNNDLKHFPVYGPKAFAVIGRLPDSLMDRSIVIKMQRRNKDQQVERFLQKRAKTQALPIAQGLIKFGDDHAGDVQSAYEHFVTTDLSFLSDRDADLWIPLFAVLKVAAPSRLPELQVSARELSGSKAVDDQAESLSLKLLEDIGEVWPEDEEHVESVVLLGRLKKLPESPWGHPKHELSAQRLAKMLRPFEMRPEHYREGKSDTRGYVRSSLNLAMGRYLSDSNRHNRHTAENK